MQVLLLSTAPNPASVVPALALLSYQVRIAPPTLAAVLDARTVDARTADAVLVDARTDLVAARGLCRLLAATDVDVPVIGVLGEAGLVMVSPEWAVDDIVLSRAGPRSWTPDYGCWGPALAPVAGSRAPRW